MRLRSMLLVLLGSACCLHAAVIVTPEVVETAGEFSYNYTIENEESLGILSFQLTLPVIPTFIDSPAGWVPNSFSSGSGAVVQWASEDPSSDIEPGSSLQGFVVAGPFPPGSVPFEVRNAEFESIEGITTGPGPAAIPEPSTFGLGGILMFLPFARLWGRRGTGTT